MKNLYKLNGVNIELNYYKNFSSFKNYDDKSLVGKPGVRASMIFDKLNIGIISSALTLYYLYLYYLLLFSFLTFSLFLIFFFSVKSFINVSLIEVFLK